MDQPKQGTLVPTLGLFSTIALIVGSMIGSGIFRLPATMMKLVQDPGLLLLVWVAGGLVAICGALTFAEMAGMFPHAGGQYVFLRESVGRPWAFLYGWTMFWVVQTGIIAAVAVVFAEFSRQLIGFTAPWVPVLAVACIAFLTLVNYLGVRFGGLVQNVFTVTKFAALIGLVLFGFLFGNPTHSTFAHTVAQSPTGFALVIAFILAMIQGFFALDGWPQAAYVAPEVKDPSRTVPRAMIIAVLSVVAIYVAATWVYIYLVSAPDIIAIANSNGEQVIGAEAARAFAGTTGLQLVAAAVMASTFGTVNAYILTSPRIYYALAKDRLFWWPFAKLHPQRNTPHVALIYQGIWAGLLVTLAFLAADAYTVIIEAVVFGLWAFYIPSVVGYFLLRKRRPDAPRPYKTLGYPYVPLLFGAVALFVVGTLLGQNIYDAATKNLDLSSAAALSGIWGTLLILTGTPILAYWWRLKKKGLSNPLSETT
jgi:basic amino acid/polyamine antiporter, APA family